MYAREIDGKEHTFGVSGSLIMSGLVLYDRETETYWAQLPGWAVKGPLKGSRLQYLPSWRTTWADWRSRYPDTLAVDKGSAGSADRYAWYYANDWAGIFRETVKDKRLGVKDVIVGVDWGGEQVAYPVADLEASPAVHDRVGGTDILVIYVASTATSMVFDRTVDGRTLEFNEGEGGLLLVDTQTGSIWDSWTGEAVAGPLKGKALKSIRSTQSFWFTWADWHPGTRIHGKD